MTTTEGQTLKLDISGENRESFVEKYHERFHMETDKQLPKKGIVASEQKDLDVVGTVTRRKKYKKKERISVKPGLEVHGGR